MIATLFCHPLFAGKKSKKALGYFRGKLPPRTAYLTFDDGPSAHTAIILDILKKHGVKATFFICSYPHRYKKRKRLRKYKNNFKRYRKLLQRMVNEGHVLGNHTSNHPALGRRSRKRILRELDTNQKNLYRALGTEAPLLSLVRPPFGHPFFSRNKRRKKRVAKVINERGYLVMWSRGFDSRDSRNWVYGESPEKTRKKPGRAFKRKVKKIKKRIIRRIRGRGAIVLFHDTHNTLLKALPPIIKAFKKKKYHFETIEQYVKWRHGYSSSELVVRRRAGEL